MRRFGVVLTCMALAFAPAIAPAKAATHHPRAMRSFGSDGALKRYLRSVAAYGDALEEESGPPPPPPPPPPAAPPAVGMGPGAPPAPNITNVQTVGVDEGGIVKVHGWHLVVLRRGRLFTVDTRDGRLVHSDTSDAFAPGDTTSAGAWYDEMLVTGDTVAVVGYNYERGGTEINRFHIDDAGKLTFIDTHHLRSNDYYSSDNYASRLIGSKLVFYTPLWLDPRNPVNRLPAVSAWRRGEVKPTFERVIAARNIYLPDLLFENPKARINVLHSVTTCDLATPEFKCSATGVLGAVGRTFYVGNDAVYVWTGDLFQRRWNDERAGDPRGLVYRFPFGDRSPQAAVVWGGPANQFSLRSEPDGTLHALVRAGYGGDAMWLKQRTTGGAALLTLPDSEFGRGGAAPRARDYRPLPMPTNAFGMQNRYIGDTLVYAAQSYDGTYSDRTFHAYDGPRLARFVPLSGGPIVEVEVGDVSRIDRMGDDAILIGPGEGGLRFQAFGLAPAPARLDSYVLPAADESESRSQGYFYRADNASGTDGILGLPIAFQRFDQKSGQPRDGAGVFYMTRSNRRLAPAGQLESANQLQGDDGCKASCVDWYGNARPIFFGNRVFALLGYELVEGALAGGRLQEVRRIDFAPAPVPAR